MSESMAGTTTQKPVLEVEHAAKAYGRHQVLKDVTFRIRPGEITAITGENSSGKSTLLNVIVGRLPADAGRIFHGGVLGYCPQELLIFGSLTVEENLRYFATAYGLHRQQGVWQRAANGLLERFRCSQYTRTPVSRLSGGTKQKLNLILAFLHSPDLLVLDEPYAGFDWETYLQFWEYARELGAEGKSILIVAHLVTPEVGSSLLAFIVAILGLARVVGSAICEPAEFLYPTGYARRLRIHILTMPAPRDAKLRG